MPRSGRLLAIVAAGLAMAGCGGGGTVPAEWRLAAAPEGTSTLELEVAVGVPCNTVGGVGVLESSTEVQVQVGVQPASGPCDTVFTTHRIPVTLSSPLGDRTLTGCVPPEEFTIRFGDEPVQGCHATATAASPFTDPALAGQCEEVDVDVDEGPGVVTPEEALAEFVAMHSVLATEGVEVTRDGIRFRGAEVGEVSIASLREGGFAVTAAQWCYPGS